jgi:hypothetical protein
MNYQQSGSGKATIKAVILFMFTLSLAPPVSLGSEESEVCIDTVFVKQSAQEGIYLEITGKILELTQKHIFMETTDGERVRYLPVAIKKVGLDTTRSGSEEWQKIVDIYWNKNTSLWVTIIQDMFGNKGLFLSTMTENSSALLAILILIAILSYIGYRLYEMLIVNADLRKINRTKLTTEIDKLQYEITSIKKQFGIEIRIPAVETTAESGGIVQEKISHGFDLPQIQFIKYKIFRLLTTKEKDERKNRLQNKWKKYKKKSGWKRKIVLFARLSVNTLAIIFVSIFGFGALVDVVLPLADPTFLAGGSALISLLFFILFYISLVLFIRLRTKRKLIRDSYDKAFPVSSNDNLDKSVVSS